MTSHIRTRFAPSPTGALHLGNIRTAILNWLFARHHGGAFVLRLEDTDTQRNVDGGEALILEALDWLGLGRDEGPGMGGPFGPYRQSERDHLYAARADALLDSGQAFRCFCTADEIEARRTASIEAGEPPGRDPLCSSLPLQEADRLAAAGRPAAIRLRVPTGPVEFPDHLKGTLSIDGDDLGDMVLVRSDGRPTYNFAVAVDDLEMNISHVIRGVGHLSNTPKQVLLYRAFGVEPPIFVHIPTVLAPGGGKLSKRLGATGVLEYRARGYHPDAIINYLSLLSWSSKSGEEILSRDALIAQMDLDRIGSTDSELDEEKMAWLSGQHLRGEPPARLGERWADFHDLSDLDVGSDDLERAAEVFAERTQLLGEARPELERTFREPNLQGEIARQALRAPEAGPALAAAREAWGKVRWHPESLKLALREAGAHAGLEGRALFGPIRAALTGEAHGPDLAKIAYALGSARTLSRLDRAAERTMTQTEEDA